MSFGLLSGVLAVYMEWRSVMERCWPAVMSFGGQVLCRICCMVVKQTLLFSAQYHHMQNHSLSANPIDTTPYL